MTRAEGPGDLIGEPDVVIYNPNARLAVLPASTPAWRRLVV
jgi:hypothetical protein